MTDEHKYDDIINLPHHVYKKHARMSAYDRAAQFSPFAALTGHSQAIKETERKTERRKFLTEDEKQIINDKIIKLIENPPETEISVTYFIYDKRKAGGKYVTIKSRLDKIDKFNRNLKMSTGEIIPVYDIIRLEL